MLDSINHLREAGQNTLPCRCNAVLGRQTTAGRFSVQIIFPIIIRPAATALRRWEGVSWYERVVAVHDYQEPQAMSAAA